MVWRKRDSAGKRTNYSRSENPNVFLIFLLLFFVLFASPVDAGRLEGTVVGKANNIKSFVRVEIQGPEGKITRFTDREGKFSVNLVGGQYGIQVIEMNQGDQFSVNVPTRGDKTQIFKLKW